MGVAPMCGAVWPARRDSLTPRGRTVCVHIFCFEIHHARKKRHLPDCKLHGRVEILRRQPGVRPGRGGQHGEEELPAHDLGTKVSHTDDRHTSGATF